MYSVQLFLVVLIFIFQWKSYCFGFTTNTLCSRSHLQFSSIASLCREN